MDDQDRLKDEQNSQKMSRRLLDQENRIQDEFLMQNEQNRLYMRSSIDFMRSRMGCSAG